MKNTDAAAVTVDEGTAYGHKAPHYDSALAEVGPGSAMGEYLRRYWHPIELADNVKDVPIKIRVLGEDLVLFRTQMGTPGLLYHRCMHRGTSLEFAKCESDGLRCCYHGWMFDPQGRCVDQPAEPNRGIAKASFIQPWYPVQERYGLIWAYMGPPEKKPLLPTIEIFENLGPEERLYLDDRNIGAMLSTPAPVPFNWFQHFENLPDLAHFAWLHVLHSGAQFDGGGLNAIFQQPNFETWRFMRDSVSWEHSRAGQVTHMRLRVPGGPMMRFTLEAAMPTWRCVPNPWGKIGVLDHIGFVLPVDDVSFRIFTVLRGEHAEMYDKVHAMVQDKADRTRTQPDYPKRHPDDWEAQFGQGPITFHSEEHLVRSDRGIVMLRKLYREQIERVQRGDDPIGIGFTPEDAIVQLSAGLFVEYSGDS